jgi:hypothetical protein
VGQRNSVPVGTTSHRMKQRAAAEAAALRAPPPRGGMSLAGDDGKGKSALCSGRLKLMAVEQIALPSLLIPSWGGRRRPRREARTLQGYPMPDGERPGELAGLCCPKREATEKGRARRGLTSSPDGSDSCRSRTSRTAGWEDLARNVAFRQRIRDYGRNCWPLRWTRSQR